VIPVSQEDVAPEIDEGTRHAVQNAMNMVISLRRATLEAIADLNVRHEPLLRLYTMAWVTHRSLSSAVGVAGGITEFGTVATAIVPAVRARGWDNVRPALVALHQTHLPAFVAYMDQNAGAFTVTGFTSSGEVQIRSPIEDPAIVTGISERLVAIRDSFDTN